MKQPVPETVVLKDAKQFRYIGKPMKRLDARAKSSGRQQFGIDFKPEGAKLAMVAHPPVFGAKVAKFDASKAKAIRGVLAVRGNPGRPRRTRYRRDRRRLLAGQAGPRRARHPVEYRWPRQARFRCPAGRVRRAVQDQGRGARRPMRPKLASAAKKISAVYEFPYLAHAPMEPINCTVDLKDDSCTLWVGSQFQTGDQAAAAATAGLKPEQVTLHTMMAGGGFGRRAVPTSDFVVEAVNIAKAWKAAGHAARSR
jgi:isoquinoline 1-oxidoreductase beta subunit